VSVTVGTNAEYARTDEGDAENSSASLMSNQSPVARFTAGEETLGGRRAHQFSLCTTALRRGRRGAWSGDSHVRPAHDDRGCPIPEAFDFPDGTDIWFPATAIASPSADEPLGHNNRRLDG